MVSSPIGRSACRAFGVAYGPKHAFSRMGPSSRLSLRGAVNQQTGMARDFPSHPSMNGDRGIRWSPLLSLKASCSQACFVSAPLYHLLSRLLHQHDGLTRHSPYPRFRVVLRCQSLPRQEERDFGRPRHRRCRRAGHCRQRRSRRFQVSAVALIFFSCSLTRGEQRHDSAGVCMLVDPTQASQRDAKLLLQRLWRPTSSSSSSRSLPRMSSLAEGSASSTPSPSSSSCCR